MRPEILFLAAFVVIIYLIPWILAFTWIRVDADRSGQPGILWALLSIPFGWTCILVYAIVRAIRGSGAQRAA
jgi:hypothetical protein